RLPGVIFFCISDTLVPTTYLVDTTLSDASDYDQTVHAVRLPGLPVLPLANCPRFFRVTCFCLFSGAAILITANNL
ncbi:hypothetical protein ACMV55_16875, partial [Klebsiella pneumoniae]|uniref:hypothetical protein n=1 Tax=Klebsiella pneumoniae TaxID=573 RepID=UPI0039E1A80E